MKAFAEQIILAYGWSILLALGIVISLYYLAKFAVLINYAINTLKTVKSFLVEKLGDKAGLIIDILIEGLTSIQDGDLSEQEMIDEFIKIIKMRAASAELTVAEQEIVEEAARMTIQSIAKDKNKQKAFKLLSKR